MTIVSLSSLTIFLVPLIALLLSYDAIVGEVGTWHEALLLAYPVARWQVIRESSPATSAVLGCATGAGYGVAGVPFNSPATRMVERWIAFIGMVASSVLLGAVFVAIGYFQRVRARPRRGRRYRHRGLARLRTALRHGARSACWSLTKAGQ